MSFTNLAADKICNSLTSQAASEVHTYGTKQVKNLTSTGGQPVNIIDDPIPAYLSPEEKQKQEVKLLKAEIKAMKDRVKALEKEVDNEKKMRMGNAERLRKAKEIMNGFRGWRIDAESRWKLADLKEVLDCMDVE